MRPNLAIRALVCLALAAGLVGADGAGAQPFERRPALAEAQSYPPQRGRGYDVYSVMPGHRGTITASTPNKDGNFGGPSNGGSGGGR